MHVFPRHQLHKLIDIQLIFISTRQPTYYFGLILANIVAVLIDHLLKLVNSNFILPGKSLKILPQVSSLLIVLDKGVFELVQLEHIDVLSLELLVDVLHLLIEVSGVIQRRNCILQFPLGLLALPLVDAVPPH